MLFPSTYSVWVRLVRRSHMSIVWTSKILKRRQRFTQSRFWFHSSASTTFPTSYEWAWRYVISMTSNFCFKLCIKRKVCSFEAVNVAWFSSWPLGDELRWHDDCAFVVGGVFGWLDRRGGDWSGKNIFPFVLSLSLESRNIGNDRRRDIITFKRALITNQNNMSSDVHEPALVTLCGKKV